MSENFYGDLPAFPDFSGLGDPANFHPAPVDWHVVVVDVMDSTRALREGKYRDVNTLGAAAIAAATQAAAPVEIPYAFGGDGATFLVPPSRLPHVRRALHGIRGLGRSNFDLALRVGDLPVQAVLDEGLRLDVARFDLNSGRTIAFFRGGGVSRAEEIVKGGQDGLADSHAEPVPDLRGISCRWQPVPSRRGRILSILVEARPGAPHDLYPAVLNEIEGILEEGLHAANPIVPEVMSYRSADECRRAERKLHASPFESRYFKRIVEILAAVAVFALRVPPVVFDPAAYARAMRTHSDYRKFDDVLRMVIDASPGEAEALRNAFEARRARGEIHYGIHESDSAIMTCLVESMKDGGHIHFVDGGDGGYTIAARELKAQKKAPAL